jgi:ketosteroid isomerase-like protein
MSASAPNDEAALKALVSLADAFNAHDLDRIMSHFAEDAVLEIPRGRDPWGICERYAFQYTRSWFQTESLIVMEAFTSAGTRPSGCRSGTAPDRVSAR